MLVTLNNTAAVAPEPIDDRAALAALRADSLRVSAVAVAATSIAVHLTRTDKTAAAQFSVDLMRPSFSPAASRHVAVLTADESRAEVAQAWTILNADLETANYTGELVRKGSASYDTLRKEWQRACRSLLEWHALLQPIMLERGAVSDAAHDAPTLAMLRRAGAGETPILNASGPFAQPAGTERRRDPRHEVSVPAVIVAGTRQFEARIANISTRGLLVVADRQISTGRTINVILEDGRTLTGKVCWSNVRQMGVALDSSLSTDDALWSHIKIAE